MKKKIKDLTLEEVHKICNKYLYCGVCPLYAFEYHCAKEWVGAFNKISYKEIEIDE